MATRSRDWQEIVAEKIDSIGNDVPYSWPSLPATITRELKFPLEAKPNRILEMDIPRKTGSMTDRELDITENYTVERLLANLASGGFTAVEVMIAFCKRAMVAQKMVRHPGVGSVKTSCTSKSYEYSCRVSLMSSSKKHSNVRSIWMQYVLKGNGLLVPCMDFPSA